MRKAALKGNPSSFYGLAYLFAPKKNKKGKKMKSSKSDTERSENFIMLLKIAVEFGSRLAAFILAQLYVVGQFVEKNYVMSLVYAKYAADKKLPNAMLMYANRLRVIANDEITLKKLAGLKEKARKILNNLNDYGTRSNQLRLTASRLFATIEDPNLADFVSRVYYKKIIDDDSCSSKIMKEAVSKLKELKENKKVEDMDEEQYYELYCKTIYH